MTLSQSDYYPWTYYIFFVNNDIIIISVFMTQKCLSLTEPAKLSSCRSKWHHTSYHQHCGHPRVHT